MSRCWFGGCGRSLAVKPFRPTTYFCGKNPVRLRCNLRSEHHASSFSTFFSSSPSAIHQLLRLVSYTPSSAWKGTMGKHYCDYCDVFLTHDSVSVRKAHNSGRNHLQNVREYYQTLDPDQIQQVLDTLAQEYDRRGIEKPRDLLQPAGSSFMTFGAGPLSGTSDRGRFSLARPKAAQQMKHILML